MAKMNPETGRFQVSCEVNPGVYEKMVATIEAEGGPMSALVRRAILRELRCNVDGNAIDPPNFVVVEDTRQWRCWKCKTPGAFADLESTGGLCARCEP